jgi:hypothetical protein
VTWLPLQVEPHSAPAAANRQSGELPVQVLAHGPAPVQLPCLGAPVTNVQVPSRRRQIAGLAGADASFGAAHAVGTAARALGRSSAGLGQLFAQTPLALQVMAPLQLSGSS